MEGGLSGTPFTVHKLVQISGVDSKVQAIVSDHLNFLNSKSKKNNSKKKKGRVPCYPQMLHDLRLVLVVDGRGVPPENASVVESFPHVADMQNYIGSLDPIDQLTKSSTMLRFIEADVYYPGLGYQELSAKFDLRWLVDTGQKPRIWPARSGQAYDDRGTLSVSCGCQSRPAGQEKQVC